MKGGCAVCHAAPTLVRGKHEPGLHCLGPQERPGLRELPPRPGGRAALHTGSLWRPLLAAGCPPYLGGVLTGLCR